MNNNNSVAIIVVGLLGFLVIAITGKWLIESENKKNENRIEINTPYFKSNLSRDQTQSQIIVTPNPTTNQKIIIGRPYPRVYHQFHRKNEFWQGYSDGWKNLENKNSSPEYNQGHQIGSHDRISNRTYYYEKHFPHGFSVKAPNFRLNIN
jgi:hypothetical protein